MTDWKRSRYVTEIEVQEGDVYLLFSALFGRLVEVPANCHVVIRDLLDSPNSLPTEQHSELRKTLIDQGILVPGQFDELQHIAEDHRWVKFTPGSSLGLTICPTLACNFRCTYCYQRHPGGKMSREVRDQLLNYVNSVGNLQSLAVTWFGGEPLQGLNIIEDLSNGFAQGNYQYTGSIVTNGSRLTRETSQRLVELSVKWAQVTLDGPRAYHNARRPLANGAGTFDLVLDNIRQVDPRLAISIRVNVDHRNVDGIPELFDQLDEAGLQGSVAVYFAPVAPYTEVCADVIDECVIGSTWARLETQLTFLATERGYANVGLPSPRTNVCLADRASDFVVVPSGLVFNCWNDVTDRRRAVFDLKTMSRSEDMAGELKKWATWGPYEFEDCRSCHVLPLCLGGCPSVAMRLNKGACGTLKHNLKDRVLLYYLGAKRAQCATALKNALSSISGPEMPSTETGAISEAFGDRRSRELLSKKIAASLVSWASGEHGTGSAGGC